MNWKTPLLLSLHYSWVESSIATTPPDSLHVIVKVVLCNITAILQLPHISDPTTHWKTMNYHSSVVDDVILC